MRIVFMGTPDFAVPSLKALLDKGHTVCGVFTQPDKARGRGHKLQMSPVKEFAMDRNLTVYQPKTLKDPEVQKVIFDLAPELIVVVAYGKILPKSVLDLPAKGCINVHGSLLPKYRGAAPIQWAVINGEAVTGITTMFMAEGLDTGDMLLKAETAIGEQETAGELFDRLKVIGADLLIQTVEQLEVGLLNPVSQDKSLSSYASMLTKEDAKIDWTQSAKAIHQMILGMNPAPIAYTCLRDQKLKVYSATVVEFDSKTADAKHAEAYNVQTEQKRMKCEQMQPEKLEDVKSEGLQINQIQDEQIQTAPAELETAQIGSEQLQTCQLKPDPMKPGQIQIEKNSLLIRCGDGMLKLGMIQGANGKRMDAGSYLRGHALKSGDCFS